MNSIEPTFAPRTFHLNPRWLVRGVFFGFLAAEIVLVLLDLFVNYKKFASSDAIRRLCNITREDGLANWLSSTLLLANGAILWMLQAFAARPAGARGVNWRRVGWIILAVFFTYMAIDDAAALHERVGTGVSDLVGKNAGPEGALTEFKSYTWQIVFLPVFGAFGLFMLLFFLKEFRGSRLKLLTFLAVSCWVVAVGLDHVEGLSKDTKDPNPYYDPICKRLECRRYTVEHFSKSFEEFLEMFGATLFLTAFVTKLTRVAEEVTVRFSKEPPTAGRATPPRAAPPAP